MQNQKYLLPIGLYDLLKDEAKINQQTIDLLLQSFYGNDYELIKTPLIEFEESFALNRKVDEQSFKMVDNFSGKTLVLRSDITPQIARLVATKFQNISDPIKLCYVGDVVKTKNDNLYADRQLTQAGIEMIGEDSCDANIEVIELILKSLKKIKIENLMINFCYPQLLDILLKNLSVKNIDDLKNAIIRKNISAIKNFGEKYADDLMTLVLENSDFEKIDLAINNLKIEKGISEKIKNWQKTILDIQKITRKLNFLSIFSVMMNFPITIKLALPFSPKDFLIQLLEVEDISLMMKFQQLVEQFMLMICVKFCFRS